MKNYRPIITITLTYVIFATLWILFSDRVLARIITDPQQYVAAQTYKGWFFVLVTGLLLYNTILHEFKRHWKSDLEVERIASFSKDIRGVLDPHTLTLKILNQLCNLFLAPEVYFGQLDTQSNNVKLSYLSNNGEMMVQYLPESDPFWQQMLSSKGQPIRLTTAQPIGQWTNLASVPLIAHETIIAVIGFAREIGIQHSDTVLLQAVADIAGQAFYVADLLHNNVTQIRRLSSLRKIDDTILTDFNIHALIQILLREFVANLGIDAVAITVLNTQNKKVDIFAQSGLQNVDSRYEDQAYGYASVCDSILVIQNTKAGIHSERNYPLQHPIHNPELLGYAVSPLISQDQKLGIVEVYSHQEIEWDRENLQFFEALARQTAIAIDRVNLVLNLQKSNIDLIHSYEETLEGWSRALDMRDHETENHTRRVTELTVEMGTRLGLSPEQLVQMRRGALLHDIGKLAVPDTILLKESDLTPQEREVMQQHPITARTLIEPISFLAPAIIIPFFHHEKWDGSGYPQGLSGGSIPIEARIFAIVDVWDALTNDRPYRAALSPLTAARHILGQAGKHFDPQMVNAFLEMINGKGILSDADMLHLGDHNETI